MKNGIIVPATSFAASVVVWLAFFILFLTGRWIHQLAPVPGLVLCFFAGGLVFFAGIRCRRLNGPRVGHIVRSSVLFIMALFTFWKVGVATSCLLLAWAIASGTLAILDSGPREQDTVSSE